MRFAMAIGCLLFSAVSTAQTYTTQTQKFSYTLGYQVAKNIQREAGQLDVEAFTQGVKDVHAGSKLKLSMAEMQQAIMAHQATKAKAQKKASKNRQAEAKANAEAGKKFLQANKAKEGVVVTASGLQYKVITAGTGKQPKATDKVEVHYRGTLLNGKQFDSSYDRGKTITFPLGNVIKGWQEALQLMKEGAKWQIVIPSELAYGVKGAGKMIGPNSTLIFDVELISVK